MYQLMVLAFTQAYLLYLSILVVNEPYSVLSNLITMYVPTFKMPTISQVQQLIQQDDYAF